MFTRIANYAGNTYFEYDYGDTPSRVVEVRSIPREINASRWDLTMGDERVYQQIARNWSELVGLERYFSKKEVMKLRYRGIVPDGYSFHHVHPRALGGETTDLRNLVLMPNELHTRLHDFMRDFIIVKCLPLVRMDMEIPHKKKVFMTLPVLPPVVSEQDVAFAMKLLDFEADITQAKEKILGYLKRYPNAFERPLFINGVIAQGPHKHNILSWPPARVRATQGHQLHKTGRIATRCEPERWSFTEWSAQIRNRSKNARF